MLARLLQLVIVVQNDEQSYKNQKDKKIRKKGDVMMIKRCLWC